LGGFLTPFLLSTGEVNPVGLFTYLAVLDLGLLVVAWRMDSWMSIEPLSLAGTYLIYALWLGESYAENYFIPAFLFLVLFWMMFHAVHAIRIIRGVATYSRFRLGLASLHGALFYILLYALLNIDHPDWRVPATLVVAILYGSTSLAARGRSAGDGVFLQSTLTAIGLVICATFIQFKGMALAQYLSVEALALTWAGSQWRLRSVWGGGVVLFAVAFLFLLGAAGALFASPSEPFTPILNIRAFTFLLLVAGLALAALLVGRLEQPGARAVRTVLHYAWCGVLLLLISLETNDFFAQMIRHAGVTREQHLVFLRAMVMPVVWGAYALLLMLGGRLEENRPVVSSGLGVLFLAGCAAIVRGLTYVPIGEMVPVWNERVGLLLLVIAGYGLARKIVAGRTPVAGAAAQLAGGIQAGIILLFLVLITGEIWDYYALAIYRLALVAGPVNIVEEMSRLQNLRQLFLSAGWLVYSIILMALGLWRRARPARIQAIILFGVSILKIFIYDLSFLDTLYRIFSFVGLGIILLAVSYLYQRYRGIILGSPEATGTP
ncbi:MAG TPA: DUF2339 domain-containing protein, partial [Bacteroidota bacterium]|nr:DUF2339 domain-containing protein [Bacteroidota bacterium]